MQETDKGMVILFAMIAAIAKKLGMTPEELIEGIKTEMSEQKYISDMLIAVIRMTQEKHH